jgi:hypothetical protein
LEERLIPKENTIRPGVIVTSVTVIKASVAVRASVAEIAVEDVVNGVPKGKRIKLSGT